MRKMVWAALLGAATMANAAQAETLLFTVTNGNGVTSWEMDSDPTVPDALTYNYLDVYKYSAFRLSGTHNGASTNFTLLLTNYDNGNGNGGFGSEFTAQGLFHSEKNNPSFDGLFDLSNLNKPRFNTAPATYTWASDAFANGPGSLSVAPAAPGPEVGLGLSGVFAAITALILTRRRRAALA